MKKFLEYTIKDLIEKATEQIKAANQKGFYPDGATALMAKRSGTEMNAEGDGRVEVLVLVMIGANAQKAYDDFKANENNIAVKRQIVRNGKLVNEVEYELPEIHKQKGENQ